MIKSCFDSSKTFLARSAGEHKQKKRVLILLLSDFLFVLCKRSRQKGEKPRHSFAHTSPKMVTIILCFKSKSFNAENQFQSMLDVIYFFALRRNRKKNTIWKTRKIIGTIFKVNQNQITSKFHNSHPHSLIAVRFFCDLEFLMFLFFVCENNKSCWERLRWNC